MGKKSVTHACGHTEVYRFSGPRRDRDWQAKRLAGRDCDACYRAKRDAAHAAENAAAAATAHAAGLPDLTGVSAKQIDYATTVRQRALDSIPELTVGAGKISAIWADWLDAAGVANDVDVRVEAARDCGLALLATATDHTEAGWWLDQSLSDRTAHVMCRAMIDQITAMIENGSIDQKIGMEIKAGLIRRPIAVP